MSNQIYQIQLKSPMGIKKGLAEINPEKGCISLNLLSGINLFDGEFAAWYGFRVKGTLQTALHQMPASLQGSIMNDHLQAVLHTAAGSFPIEGILEEVAKGCFPEAAAGDGLEAAAADSDGQEQMAGRLAEEGEIYGKQ